jgi:hypothetical protein
MLWILFSGFYVAAKRQRKADHETRSGCKRPPPGKHSRAEIKGAGAAHHKKKTGKAGPVSQREKMLLIIKMPVQSGINMV